ncbi:MAG: cellulase family glycosylhydrolase [Oscillospiraceae bacterium]|nr:cellulase family glycosylhydrolase [Oscillospiraceae bacterium]
MALKKLSALLLTFMLCMMLLPASAYAAETKGIKLSKSSATLAVGDTLTLKRTVTGIAKGTVQWSSSDKTVAAVSKGVVTAKKTGTAVITAKIKDTDYKASCKITVKAKASGKKESGTAKKTAAYSSAKDITDKMTIGWNLGNTLDSSDCEWYGSNDIEYEMAWGNPKTTKAMIDMVKKAGFNTIRIPVSWGQHMDSRGKVNKGWMDRVQEIVDYAYDNDMFIILNTHHDEGWIKFDDKNSEASIKKFTYLWEQISERFKDYDQRLIFEGLNEPRTKGSANEWNGGTSPERKILNKYYVSFVKTVRGSGGNNSDRMLILTPYGASPSYEGMSDLEVPDDKMIAVSIHAYTPYNVAMNRYSADKELTEWYKGEIDGTFANINKIFVSKGIPVVLDEFGYINKSNTKERVEIIKYYLSVTEKYGIPCCWWDNGANCLPADGEGFAILDRRNLKWYYPDIVKALTESVK